MWYDKVTANIGEIPNFIEYYERELESNRKCVRIQGNLEQNIARLPGDTEMIFNQLQDIEAILKYLEIQLRKVQQKYFQNYMEKYGKALTSRDAEKYADSEQEVIDFECLINSVALLRNKYLGIIKALESKNFMVGHITRLRCAGMEDITI
jgi:hypothetical protein